MRYYSLLSSVIKCLFLYFQRSSEINYYHPILLEFQCVMANQIVNFHKKKHYLYKVQHLLRPKIFRVTMVVFSYGIKLIGYLLVEFDIFSMFTRWSASLTKKHSGVVTLDRFRRYHRQSPSVNFKQVSATTYFERVLNLNTIRQQDVKLL